MVENILSSIRGIGKKKDIILKDIKIMWQLQIWSPERLNMVIKKKPTMCYIVLKSLLNKKFNKEVSGVQLVWQT